MPQGENEIWRIQPTVSILKNLIFPLKKDPLQADVLILVISFKTRYTGDQTRPHLNISKETGQAP